MIKVRKLAVIKYQNYKFLNNCLAVQNIMRNFAPEINGWPPESGCVMTGTSSTNTCSGARLLVRIGLQKREPVRTVTIGSHSEWREQVFIFKL